MNQRRATTGIPMLRVTVCLPPADVERLDAVARACRRSRSELVSVCVGLSLDALEEKAGA